MPSPKKPAKHDTLTGPSTGRTIEVDPSWVSESPPTDGKSSRRTIEVDPAWLTEGDPEAKGPPRLPRPARAAKPPPLATPPALRGKRAVAPSIPRDEPEEAAAPRTESDVKPTK